MQFLSVLIIIDAINKSRLISLKFKTERKEEYERI